MKSRTLWRYRLASAGFLLVWGWNSSAFAQYHMGTYSNAGSRVQAPVVSHRHALTTRETAPSYDTYSPSASPFPAPYDGYGYGSCDPCFDGGYDPLLNRCPNSSCRDNRRTWRHCWVKTCYDPKPAYALPNYGFHATSWRKIDDGGACSPYANTMPYQAAPMQPPAANMSPAPAPEAAPGTETPQSAPNATPAPNNTIPSPPSPNEGLMQPPPAIENPQPAPTTQPQAQLRGPSPDAAPKPHSQLNEEELPEVEAGLAPYPAETSPTLEAKEVIPQKPSDSHPQSSGSHGNAEPRGEGDAPQIFLPPAPTDSEKQRDANAGDIGSEHTGDGNEDRGAEQRTDAEPRQILPGPNLTDEKLEESPSDLSLPPSSEQPEAKQQPQTPPVLDDLQTRHGGRDRGEERWEMPVPYTGPQQRVSGSANASSRASRSTQLDRQSRGTEKNILPTANWGTRPKPTLRSGVEMSSPSTRGRQTAAPRGKVVAGDDFTIIPLQIK